MAFGSYRGVIAAAYDEETLIQALEPPEELWNRPGIEVLTETRNRVGILRLPMSPGVFKDIVVKEFSLRGVTRIKSLLLASKAAKAWRGAVALIQRELDTAPPVAYFEKRRGGFLDRSFFLAERIERAEEIRGLLRDLPPADLETLLAALAEHLFVCHERGILHRDLSDGNILVKKDENGVLRFHLLDTNRVRVREKIGSFRRIKNLIRLGIPASRQEPFLRRYFGLRPLKKSHWIWYRINKAFFSGYVSLKKKLRLRQIARRLRIQ
jgi:serine/threonine protein kinase